MLRFGKTIARCVIFCGVASLFSGCLMTRLVDHSFLGMFYEPEHKDRKYTGVLLATIAVPLDIATSPLQFIGLAIFGDDFVEFEQDVSSESNYRLIVSSNEAERHPALSDEQELRLADYLDAQRRAGEKVPPVLGLTEGGDWVAVNVDEQTEAAIKREFVLARAAQLDTGAEL